MSITMIMRRIDPAAADEIKKAPERAAGFLFPKKETKESPRGFFSFLKKKEPAPEPAIDWEKIYHHPDVLDLDKAYDGLHFLLTDGSAPFENVNDKWWICPGDDRHIDSDGHDCFLIPADETPAFLAAVQALDETAIRSRFDPEKMNETPVGMWDWTEDPETHIQYLLTYRNKLLAFLQYTREQGSALLSTIVGV